MDWHTIARVVFMVTLLCTVSLYVAIYSRLDIAPKFLLRGEHLRNKSLVVPGHAFRNKQPEDSRDSISMSLPVSDVVNLGKEAGLNLNLPFGNIDQANKQINDLVRDIIRDKINKINKAMCNTVNCSTTYTQTDDVTTKLNGRKSFLTLLTTWSYNPKMLAFFNNTLNNWASFYPTVLCLIFTNDSRVEEVARHTSCRIHTIDHHASNGLPILKYMYNNAMEVFDSEFYGYANSDILFTDNLIKTLTTINYIFSLDTRPLMITGQRWNIVNASSSEVKTKKLIDELASKRGSLFQPWAADYFITKRGFPWDNVLDIVIGSLGLDNWLIIQSRQSHHVIVDASKTILAVHQSLDEDMYRSHDRSEASYNLNLIAAKHGWQAYERGKVNCIENVTDIELDRIVIRQRVELADYCKM